MDAPIQRGACDSPEPAGDTSGGLGPPSRGTGEVMARVWRLFLHKLVAEHPEHPWAAPASVGAGSHQRQGAVLIESAGLRPHSRAPRARS